MFAPFEFDSEIDWMAKQGMVDLAISNDGDLLFHGLTVIKKWNGFKG